MNKSKLYAINGRDLAKGAIMAFMAAFVASLYDVLTNGKVPDLVTLKMAASAGLLGLLSYLMKNFFTDQNDKFSLLTTNPDKPRPPQP